MHTPRRLERSMRDLSNASKNIRIGFEMVEIQLKQFCTQVCNTNKYETIRRIFKCDPFHIIL